MSSKKLHFYNDRICLNVLAGSIANAKEIVEAIDGYVIVGVLSSNYPTLEEATADMHRYQEATGDRLSVGLGAGNPNQCYMVADLADKLQPAHVNQVFTMVGSTRARTQKSTWINALVSPTGTPGIVNISTGPQSSKQAAANVPVETAIAMIKEVGGDSIKYFPMGGLKCADEFRTVAKACAEAGLALEPTGGIDLNNFKEIVKIALDAGVQKVIPHVYSSIIDKATGNTKIEDVKALYAMMKELAG